MPSNYYQFVAPGTNASTWNLNHADALSLKAAQPAGRVFGPYSDLVVAPPDGLDEVTDQPTLPRPAP